MAKKLSPPSHRIDISQEVKRDDLRVKPKGLPVKAAVIRDEKNTDEEED